MIDAKQFTSAFLYQNAVACQMEGIDPADLRDWFFVIGKVTQNVNDDIQIALDSAVPVVIDNDGRRNALIEKYGATHPEFVEALKKLPTREQITKKLIPEYADYNLISAEMMPWVVEANGDVGLAVVQRPYNPANPAFKYQRYLNAPAGRVDGTIRGTANAEFNEEILMVVVTPSGPEILTAPGYTGDLAALRAKQFELNADILAGADITREAFMSAKTRQIETSDIQWDLQKGAIADVTVTIDDEGVENLRMTHWYDAGGNTWQLRLSTVIRLNEGERLLTMPGEKKNTPISAYVVDPDKVVGADGYDDGSEPAKEGEVKFVPTTIQARRRWPGQSQARELMLMGAPKR